MFIYILRSMDPNTCPMELHSWPLSTVKTDHKKITLFSHNLTILMNAGIFLLASCTVSSAFPLSQLHCFLQCLVTLTPLNTFQFFKKKYCYSFNWFAQYWLNGLYSSFSLRQSHFKVGNIFANSHLKSYQKSFKQWISHQLPFSLFHIWVPLKILRICHLVLILSTFCFVPPHTERVRLQMSSP